MPDMAAWVGKVAQQPQVHARPTIGLKVLGDGKQDFGFFLEQGIDLKLGRIPALGLRQTFVNGRKVALVERGKEPVGQPLEASMGVLKSF